LRRVGIPIRSRSRVGPEAGSDHAIQQTALDHLIEGITTDIALCLRMPILTVGGHFGHRLFQIRSGLTEVGCEKYGQVDFAHGSAPSSLRSRGAENLSYVLH